MNLKSRVILSSLFVLVGFVNAHGGTEQNVLAAERAQSGVYEKSGNKYLITDNSVGFFKINASWRTIAQSEYRYRYLEGYGYYRDGCGTGGFYIGDKVVVGMHGPRINNLQLTIGAEIFENSSSYNDEVESKKYQSNPNLFYVSSNNCRGWYWTDSTRYVVVHSDLFRTKEGIGVGITLKEMEQKVGKLNFTVGWIEEDENAVSIKISAYNNIEFIIDADDYKNGWEALYGEKAELLTANHFKPSAKIKRVIVWSEQ